MLLLVLLFLDPREGLLLPEDGLLLVFVELVPVVEPVVVGPELGVEGLVGLGGLLEVRAWTGVGAGVVLLLPALTTPMRLQEVGRHLGGGGGERWTRVGGGGRHRGRRDGMIWQLQA